MTTANSKVKDWDAVEAYFDYGLDVENRRVFLLGGVEEDEIGYAIKSLYFLDGKSADPIELFIGSFGGSEYEMFGLYDVLNSLSAPIHTVAMGKCMSAAPLLVAAGMKGERWSMPNAQWMVHMGWEEPPKARYDEMEINLSHLKKLSDRWYELMAKHTTKSAAQWRQICKRVGDRYFDADQAVEWGLVDEIWVGSSNR